MEENHRAGGGVWKRAPGMVNQHWVLGVSLSPGAGEGRETIRRGSGSVPERKEKGGQRELKKRFSRSEYDPSLLGATQSWSGLV